MEETVDILLVEDNKDFAKLVQVYLQRFDPKRFNVTWKENHADAMAHLKGGSRVDLVLMDYFLPGKTGLEIAREIATTYEQIPIVFLTVNRDFSLALEVMKLGAAEYLVKEEISSPVLPKTILSVIEKQQLRDRLMNLEISRQRLRAIRETLGAVVEDFELPLREMEKLTGELRSQSAEPLPANYLAMIGDNIRRIVEKLEKLKGLKEDKTVRYIKDIRMIDLS